MHVIVTTLTGPLGLVSSTDVTRTKLRSTSLSEMLSPKAQKTLILRRQPLLYKGYTYKP